MKNLKRISSFLVMAFILILGTVQNVSAAEKFEIDRLDVTVMVNEDGTYNVTEDYTVNYIMPSLGIYRDIPTVYHFDFIDETGKRHPKTFKFPIKDIKVVGEEYSVESQIEGERIIVGPEYGDKYTGVREFSIQYKVYTQPLGLESQKEAFFQNLVSAWKTPVHEFHATVNFEKDIDLSGLVVKGQSIGQEEFPVECVIKENEFTCDVFESIYFGSDDGQANGITAQIPLPDNYFSRPTSKGLHTFSLLAAGLLAIVSLVLKFLYGTAVPIVEKVTFTAPESFTSPMVGYVFNERVKMNDLYALLFEWANKGVIRIKENEDDITFEKLKNLEFDNDYEATIFNAFFYKEGEITIDDWAKTNVYTTIMPMTLQVPKAVKRKGRIYNRQSVRLHNLMSSLLLLVMLFFSFSIINFSVMSVFVTVICLIALLFTQLIFYGTFSSLYSKYIKDNKTGIIGVWAVIYVALSLVSVHVLLVIGSKIFGLLINNVLYLIFIGIINVGLLISTTIKVRTQYGADLYGEVKGLYNFIKYAKKDELQMMQEENPHLYYDVLPYAQVFGMSDLWLNRFKEIEIPTSPYYTTYRSTTFNNYILMRSLTNSMSTIHTQVMPKVSSGTGGGSFSSGGFSGGGFSGGGGFGGGGGGSR